MTAEEAEKVKVGDRLFPFRLWNDSTRTMRLESPTPVCGIDLTPQSQTGVSFFVRTIGNCPVLLDAGWFHPAGHQP